MKTITITDEQAQQIHDALLSLHNLNAREESIVAKALATIRAARAQEQVEQEPVATLGVIHPDWFEEVCEKCNGNSNTPLYAAPVRTKDLTADEIEKAFRSNDYPGIIGGCRAVIAADREKNK